MLVVRQGDRRPPRTQLGAVPLRRWRLRFVTRANHVARYSRIPGRRCLAGSRPGGGPAEAGDRVGPEAQVDYGFRDAQGVVQAVHDAVYSGKDNLPYSPR